jgi:uroporphyrin-III C-methyltransferase
MSEKIMYPIFIVGTGPGNPELLTIRAHEAIKAADIILYDCLPAKYVTTIKNKDAEVIYLTKNHEAPAEELNNHTKNVIELLEKYYYEGKRVVRLKAGDALMFGGAGIEATILSSKKIPFKVLPGITAGAAAANLYGIRISERNETDLVLYYIAFDIKDDFYQVRQIAKLLLVGASLVLYMADSYLEKIIKIFKEEGLEGSVPALAVGMASLPEEYFIEATLDTLPEEIKEKKMVKPCTYFIGKYVTATLKNKIKDHDESAV